jgi:hypothetical protein
VQPPFGYDPHWSRLIDAGLAGLLTVFKWIEPQSAERLMRAWWPLLWLLPTIAGMAAIAWRIGGREAATVSLLLALVGVLAYQQFAPGRIDHHNVQIALTLLAVAATVWSDRKHWAAAAAGALSGGVLAIGLESVPYLAVCGGALALRYVKDRDAGWALRDYGLALAIAAAAAFLADVPPEHWTVYECDAIATNSMAAVVCVGLVLAFAGWLGHDHGVTRVFAVVGTGLLAVAVFVLFEPRCIRGPFALVDPQIWPAWHSYVRELQPLTSVFRTNPLTAAAIVAFPAVALVATLSLSTEPKARSDFGFLAAAAVLVVATALMAAVIRGYSYAIWLGMPLVAAATLRMFAALHIERMVPRLAAALLPTPMVVSAGAVTIAYGNGLNDTSPSLTATG